MLLEFSKDRILWELTRWAEKLETGSDHELQWFNMLHLIYRDFCGII